VRRARSATPLLCAALACGEGHTSPPKPDETPPVLSVPMIDLRHVVEFLPFGVALPGSGVINPTYEMRTDINTLDVVAVSPGVVVAIRGNPLINAEIEIRPVQNSVYSIIYDHVRESTIAVGSAVQPGTRLGRIGPWTGTQGRTELQINRDGSPTLAYCPVQFGTAEFNQAHAAAFAAAGKGATEICVRPTVIP
jgi:hypothetical protein